MLQRPRPCRRYGFTTWQWRDALDYPTGRWIGLAPLVWLVNAVAFPWQCMGCAERDRPATDD